MTLLTSQIECDYPEYHDRQVQNSLIDEARWLIYDYSRMIYDCLSIV